MQQEVDQKHLPGIVTILSRHGKVVEERIYGKKDIASGAPMTRDTIFRIFSMTKPVTGVAMMILYEEGGSFIATWTQGQVTASKVLIATGGLDVEPEIKDARTAVRDGLIRHCPICDAYEATGKRIGLISYGKCRTKEALLLRGYTADLTVLTLGRPAYIPEEEQRVLVDAGINIVLHPISRLARDKNQVAAWYSDEEPPLIFDTIYSALGMNLRSQLAVSVGAKVDEDGALVVDLHQQTSVAGLYAAGDIVRGLSQVSVAAGQAAIAATAINANLPSLRY
ncbi:MAG: serine hydrolase [Alphaproteobacteria bacterium]|nr:serine hydrolase [Alphaproteobacteria bacterium]